MSGRSRWVALWMAGLAFVPAFAQQGETETRELGWFNTTELSLVVTEGNSQTDSFGLKNVLTRAWERARFVVKADGVRANTDDDRFLLVDGGITFLPGESPPLQATNVIDPPKEIDVEKYFAEARYTRKLGGSRTWNVGGSWDRNEDAGILNRYILFSGAGNIWRNGEKLRLETSYGLSVTDREEETPDPEKEQQFVGGRLTLDIEYKITKSTTLGYDFTGNLNLEDAEDYSLDSRGSLAVAINKRLSLAVSLQFLFNSEPALEDVDIVARIDVIDPDGVPGSGDEFFRTVSDGGSEFVVGEDRVRLEQLDTVFRSSLVVNF